MSIEAGRTLAIDLGDVRIGLAVSDPLGVTAQPLGALRHDGDDALIARLREIVEQYGVVRVVVGLPLLMSGRAGTRAEAARAFATRLGEVVPDIEVVLWDERLTTVAAERAMIADNVRRRKRRKNIDTLAAMLILQSYLDSRGGA